MACDAENVTGHCLEEGADATIFLEVYETDWNGDVADKGLGFRVDMNGEGMLLIWSIKTYGWNFRNPANLLRLVVYPIW